MSTGVTIPSIVSSHLLSTTAIFWLLTVARCAAVLWLCNCAGCRKEMCCAGAMMLWCSGHGKFSDSIENKMCSLFRCNWENCKIFEVTSWIDLGKTSIMQICKNIWKTLKIFAAGCPARAPPAAPAPPGPPRPGWRPPGAPRPEVTHHIINLLATFEYKHHYHYPLSLYSEGFLVTY